jgi:Caspase domain
MSLVYDNRPNLREPGLHAFVAGVGGYPHLPGYVANPGEIVTPAPRSFQMGQLTSFALSACEVARWLIDHANDLTVPLATCRVVLSPPNNAAAPSVKPLDGTPLDRCTRGGFHSEARYWRANASQNPSDMALFYFAGHGLQRSRGDSVMLMEDFGDGGGGTLNNAVSSLNLYNGMVSTATRPNIAQTQLYFIDACRVMPSEFKDHEMMSVPDLWDIEVGGPDLRRAPIFYAARSGKTSAGVPRLGTIFGLALIRCLENDAAQLNSDEGPATWITTIYSLNRALRAAVAELNAAYRGDQEFVMDRDSGDATLRRFTAPPKVKVTLLVEPDHASQYTCIRVLNENGSVVLNLQPPIIPYPYRVDPPGIDGGYYRIEATITPPLAPYVDSPPRTVTGQPPSASWKVKVVAP